MSARKTPVLCCLGIVFSPGLRSARGADSCAPQTRTQIKLLTPFGPNGLSIAMAVTERVT